MSTVSQHLIARTHLANSPCDVMGAVDLAPLDLACVREINMEPATCRRGPHSHGFPSRRFLVGYVWIALRTTITYYVHSGAAVRQGDGGG